MTMTPELLAAAIETASCPGREGPYGLYDYSEYPGETPPYVVRDFRVRGPGHGDAVFSSHDRAEADAVYDRLTREHVARAAIEAFLSATGLSA